MSKLLEITDLDIRFDTPDGEVHAVRQASLTIGAGECLGIVGESGSGKSVTFLSVLGLARGGRVGGSVRFEGRELTTLPLSALRALRGREIAITLQDALTALNPALTIGTQIEEALLAHAHGDENGYRNFLKEHRARAAAVGFDALIANGDANLTAAEHDSVSQ